MQNGDFKQLRVYKLGYEAAGRIFEITKTFPKEGRYALVDQIRRSSRSVCANIGEGYRKRIYPKHFTAKMTDADGEATETLIWLQFSLDCKYIDQSVFENLKEIYQEIGRMLYGMINHPCKFLPNNRQLDCSAGGGSSTGSGTGSSTGSSTGAGTGSSTGTGTGSSSSTSTNANLA